MIATDFVFDNERLSDYGLIICSFDGAQEGAVSSGADITFNAVSSSGSDIYKLYSATYEVPYSTSFSICKNPCIDENANNPYLTPTEVAGIQRWLCRKDRYYKFKIDDPNYANVYWKGSFSAQQYLIGGKVAGLTLVFNTNSPFGYKDDVTLAYELSASGVFTIFDQSDETGYRYPNVTIEFKNNNDLFTLTNNRDYKVCEIKNVSVGEIITLDGENLIISSSKKNHEIANDFNYAFPRLFNAYNYTENIFSVNTACNITVSYAPVKKVGM